MEFMFGMGATVRVRKGKIVFEGEVTARMEVGICPIAVYRIRFGDGCKDECEVAENHLWIVSCVPKWLRPGAEVQWMGEGAHERYVVKELRGGCRNRPRSFEAERELIRPDGTSVGRERMSTECTPANMAFWRPWQAGETGAKAGGQKKACRRKSC